MGRFFGYARVSTREQILDLQLDALMKFGVDKNDIHVDTISGATTERPGLDDVLSAMQEGDTLVVWRLDRLGRSLKHLVSIITDLEERGIAFKSIQDGAIDTSSASGKLVFSIFAALAEFERNLIRERTKAGLESARARGRLGGRPKRTLDDAKVKMARSLYKAGDLSIDEICSELGISKSTLYRWIKL